MRPHAVRRGSGIKYFTALVKDRPGHEGLAARQQVYIRALATAPHLSIHLGHFLTRPVTRALVNPPQRGPRFCEVWQTEEEPVRFVREELGAPVGVLNPHRNRSWALSPRTLPRGSFFKPIRRNVLAACQFPDKLRDAVGTIRKPKRWNGP